MSTKKTIRDTRITMPIIRKRIKWKRNWQCMCGSKKKFKNCCLSQSEFLTSLDGNATVVKDD